MTLIELPEVDAFGPEQVLVVNDAATGLTGYVVIDNLAAGPAIGGVRMAADISVVEVARLARAMTLKNAMAGLPHGGAKGGIVGDPTMPRDVKIALVRAFGARIRDVSGYIPGPDMGLDEGLMAHLRDACGRAVGLPTVLGGIPLDVLGATGFGLAVSAEVAAERGVIDLDGARVVVQGFGSVGQHTARFLAERGAVLVGRVGQPRRGVASTRRTRRHRPDRPQAGDGGCRPLPGSRRGVPRGAAGTPLRDLGAGRSPGRLHRRPTSTSCRPRSCSRVPTSRPALRRRSCCTAKGVLVLPDFVANSGGVICAAVEYAGGTAARRRSRRSRNGSGQHRSDARHRAGDRPTAAGGRPAAGSAAGRRGDGLPPLRPCLRNGRSALRNIAATGTNGLAVRHLYVKVSA